MNRIGPVLVALAKNIFHRLHSGLCKAVALRVIWGGELMNDIVFSAKPREVATKLGPAITANRGWPTEGIKPRCKYIDDRFGGKGAEHVEEGVSAPMVHTDEKGLPPKEKRSRPMCCIGWPKWLEGGAVDIGLLGCDYRSMRGFESRAIGRRS